MHFEGRLFSGDGGAVLGACVHVVVGTNFSAREGIQIAFEAKLSYC
jgi:hypothetical protein